MTKAEAQQRARRTVHRWHGAWPNMNWAILRIRNYGNSDMLKNTEVVDCGYVSAALAHACSVEYEEPGARLFVAQLMPADPKAAAQDPLVRLLAE